MTDREKLIEWCKEHNIVDKEITCDTCDGVTVCKFAFDPYNLDGDCLALK